MDQYKKRETKEAANSIASSVAMTEPHTRENIVSESFRQFIDRSYHKVSIDSICLELGISKGAVFHYFNSKYDLACESLLQGFNKLWSPHLKQIIEKGTPQEKLIQFIRSSVQMFMEHPTIRRLSYEVYEEGTNRKRQCNEWLNSYKDHMNLAARLYEDCGVSNPLGKARILIASLEGISFLFISDDSDVQLDAESVSRDLVELFVP
ncbi:MAG: TetR/AcrR family transcriptional regulator [Candidatus Thorarchaeota archaeon]